jgi:hypothetical protein
MKHLTALCACICASFVAAAPASADLSIGVADDGGKLSDDGGAWFISQFKAVGLQENRITISWNPDTPTTIPDKARLDAYIANATAAGIRLMILIAPNRARALTGSAGSTADFVRFVAQVARSYPQVKDIGVGNEPNQPRFWQPQFSSSGRALACGAYERVLAQAYDALKDVDRSITVIGVSLSPRGNDNALAATNASTSPVRCLRELGLAFKASGRKRRSWTSSPSTRTRTPTATATASATAGRTPAPRTWGGSSKPSGTPSTERRSPRSARRASRSRWRRSRRFGSG